MAESADAVVTLSPSIGDIGAAGWDACANPQPNQFNPFVAHAFLKALEDSGSTGEKTGWIPRHLTVASSEGGVVAAAPCYLKTHSQGEYVFDYGWADAYTQAGGRYYPKLQISVPFTPVPGPRLLVKPGPRSASDEQILASAAIEAACQNGLSSIHLTFIDEGLQSRLQALGFLPRTGLQFHWTNHNYASFGDFLDTLASRKRKAVRKERAEAIAEAIEIERISGASIRELHWDAMYAFYQDTGNRKWGRPYLNRAFFSLLGQAMADRCILIFAKRAGRYIAGALNMRGGDCLFGRYWGAIEHHPSLHFEICYYQAIDYAIEHRLARVEAGAQGEHKLARGYLPVTTYSAHWIADRGLRTAVARYLERERAAISQNAEELASFGPYARRETQNE